MLSLFSIYGSNIKVISVRKRRYNLTKFASLPNYRSVVRAESRERAEEEMVPPLSSKTVVLLYTNVCRVGKRARPRVIIVNGCM